MESSTHPREPFTLESAPQPKQPKISRRDDETDEQWATRQAWFADQQRLFPPGQPRKKYSSPEEQRKIAANRLLYEKKKELVNNCSWKELSNRLVPHANKKTREQIKGILENFDFQSFLDHLPDDNVENEDQWHLFRGQVFEALVLEELNGGEPNSALGYFVLHCLKKPEILGLPPYSLRNPDYLGVVVDQETGEAQITGMYEVKAGALGERGMSQLKNFYGNLKQVIDAINKSLVTLKKKYGLDLPEHGIKLAPPDEIEKFVVIPEPVTDNQVQYAMSMKKDVSPMGWGLKSSSFSLDNVSTITVFLREQYLKQKKSST